jgi:hypothetical protein
MKTEDNINIDPGEIGCEGGNWIQVAQDMIQFRAFVNPMEQEEKIVSSCETFQERPRNMELGPFLKEFIHSFSCMCLV